MTWKAIGNSVAGSSHTASGKGCEDAVQFRVLTDINGDQVLICCASDGAGSAAHAAFASGYTVTTIVAGLAELAESRSEISEAAIYQLAESVYDGLQKEADAQQAALNEFSCTLLGCCLTAQSAVFFQVGDGAIVRGDGNGFYTTVWWPHNGEYQNATTFLIDDSAFGNLNVMVVDGTVDEVAVFTDGLQMLALSMEGGNVHQPFFLDLFKTLRMADNDENIAVLNRKLKEYLNSKLINDRTDDDKTLFLASRIAV